MKKSASSLAALLSSVALGFAAPSPLRVGVPVDDSDPALRVAVASLMESLGRDAIWFDALPPDEVSRLGGAFDSLLVRAPGGPTNLPNITLPIGAPVDAAAVKASLLAALSAERRQDYETFLARREVERREASPHIANYEGRPTPISFQHPFTVKGSVERTQVAPDLRLELFAAEPDISKPIAFAWDARGRLWVAETSDYPHGLSADGAGNDRIKICEDTDGDGRADRFTVFADKLNLPTSLVFTRGGIIVSQPPQFLFLRDTDGDDRADVREVAMEGWGIRDTHAQASSLHWGFDNWIHGCVGYSGFKGTVGGEALAFQMGTYRLRPDGSRLEFLHQFTNNSWAHSQNAAGDSFGGTANNAPIFYGGIPASVVPAGTRATTAKKINVEDKVHAITPNYRQVDVFGGYTSAAGSAFIESRNLPPRLQGMAMVCEPTMKVIALMDVRPDGAGYVARDGFNLLASSDEWMSPVFAEVGPDGAVWFADWQNFIIQHNPTPSVERGGYAAKTGVGGAHENPLRDHSRGRIYRVVWDKAPRSPVTSLDGATDAQLIAALDSGVLELRLTAQRILVEEKRACATDALKKVVTANDGAAAIHALWALHGLGKLDGTTHQAALLSKNPVLRRNATRALSADATGLALISGAGVISDPSPHTRLAALVKLAEMPTTPEMQTIVRNLAADQSLKADEWLAESVKILVRKHAVQLFTEGPNLLPNPGFEISGADGLPEGWHRRDANNSAEWTRVSTAGEAHGGHTLLRCSVRGESDVSLFTDVELKPNTDYRLSGWIKPRLLRGKASFNDQLGSAETDRVTTRESDWVEVETTFHSGSRTQASINIRVVASGETWFDDVRLSEIVRPSEAAPVLVGDPARGERIFREHPTAACVLCHALDGEGSAVGPALDGIAGRVTPAYLTESLLEPNKVLANGFEALGVSPMPPLGLILKPEEIADLTSFLQTLK